LCVGVAGSSAALGDAQNSKLFVRLVSVFFFLPIIKTEKQLYF